ncbi:MAG TPA: 50S ribosomal protein L15 [Candidatus Atribacteria bacterium]|nr:50S ribosomal protein L15 [Candidatus Atribacteria bacterium]
MNLENLNPNPGARKASKRVGRGTGSGHGKTSTRGHKGQNARSGGGTRPGFEGGQMPYIRRIPKRGFKNISRKEYAIVNLYTLEKEFNAGDVVDIKALEAKGIVKKLKDGIKILGEGELTKELTVRAHKFSKTAVEKIEAAGGKVEVI